MLVKYLTREIILVALAVTTVFGSLLFSQVIIAQNTENTSDIDCSIEPGATNPCFTTVREDFTEETNPIYQRLNQVIKFASIGIGIAVTLSVVIAGIQWSASGGEPQKKAAAAGRLTNSAIALIVFALGWLILNWLVPGGWVG